MDLTNREIALLIWLVVLIAGACSIRTLRKSIPVISKVLFMGPIVRVLSFALLYAAMCVFILERAGVWQLSNCKTTVLWILTIVALILRDFKRLMEERLFF